MAKNHKEATGRNDTGVGVLLARHGGLSYLEIPAIDPRRSAAFYQNVLGWTIRGQDTDDPRFTDATGHLIGRWVTGRLMAHEPGLLPYFYVDHVDEALKHAVAHDGEVVEAAYPEGNLRVATVRDPAGNVIGLWQQA